MIYFLACAATNSVKIGFTKGVAEDRIAEIVPYSPVPLELVAKVDGCHRLEAALHAEFDELRLHNEWFRLDGPLRALVRQLIVDGGASLTDYFAMLVERHAGPTHGTVVQYTSRKCRCPACVDAYRIYQSARKRYGSQRQQPGTGKWKPGRPGRPPLWAKPKPASGV